MLTEIKTHNMRAENFSFIWGLTEGYSLEDSLSDSSEELFQRGRGEVSIYVILEKRIHAIRHTSW